MRATAEELEAAGRATTPQARIAMLSRHADVRVRALCAVHPHLDRAAAQVLVTDDSAAVRRALSQRTDLSDEHVLSLVRDPVRAVRRRAQRRAALPLRALTAVHLEGIASRSAREQLRQTLATPAGTVLVLGIEGAAHLATKGTYDRRAVRAAAAIQRNPWLLVTIAGQGTLSGRAALALSRWRDRLVQAHVGSRTDLGPLARWMVGLFGGPRARAAMVAKQWDTSVLVRLRGSFSLGREVRRVVAEQSSNRLVLLWCACSAAVDVRAGVAGNTASGVHAVRLACRRDWWPLAMAVSRPDVRRLGFTPTYRWTPAVELLAAANEHAASAVVDALRWSSDPFVRWLAALHPAGNDDVRKDVIATLEAPAWVLRRLAGASDLAANDRERILTWLALGGGTGDPNFDPITCKGTPGVVGQPVDAAYRDVATKGRRAGSSLWRTRQLAIADARTLFGEELERAAHDMSPHVRWAAAGFDHASWALYLSRDADLMVSGRAEATLQRMTSRGAPVARRTTFAHLPEALRVHGVAWAVVIAMILALGAGLNQMRSRTTSTSEYGMSTGWMVATAPSWPPRCDAGGVRVWIETLRDRPVVIVASDDAATRVKAEGFDQDRPLVSLSWETQILPGKAATLGIITPQTSIAIGQRPDAPLVVIHNSETGDTTFDFRDAEGDC